MTYVEIDLNSLIHNLNQICSYGYRPKDLYAVVKDDAYGCGAIKVAGFLESQGVNKFAVARIEEALELKEAGIKSEILVLGECSLEDFEFAASSDIVLAVNSIDSLSHMSSSLLKLAVHINIDTGMGRLGLKNNEIPKACRIINQSENLSFTGIFTHFACADEKDGVMVKIQRERFEKAKDLFKESGITLSVTHLSNSAGLINHEKKDNEFCRPGIALYGCRPDPKIESSVEFKEIMSLKSRVAMIKTIEPNDTVSYGANFVASEKTVIATVSAGYAHGIPRVLADKMAVIIRGRKFPVVGNITMDYIMVDVGLNSGVAAGDEVVIIGKQGEESITADEIALCSNTIGYEILCSLGRNKEKKYLR